MKERILQILHELIQIDSTTHTAKEKDVETYLFHLLQTMPGVISDKTAVPADSLHRAVVYGLVLGQTKHTVVFLNHHDVVGTAPYGVLAKDAFSPDRLRAALQKQEQNPEVIADLQSGDWLVGRGSCDMKGGMAAQLVVLEEYAKQPGQASVLFLSVPDEESYSDGMRAAMPLLLQLQRTYGLRYRVAINCEPSPKEGDSLVAYTGSVGKLLPVVVVQGKPVHVGNYQEGLNPIGVLSRIIASTEGNMALADTWGNEVTPPPAWMYMRDRKKHYDVSLPYRAAGWMNFLTYQKTPAQVIAILQDAAKQAIAETKTKLNVQILTGAELLELGKKKEGFSVLVDHLYHQSQLALQDGTSSYAEETISMIAHMLAFLDIMEPTIVIAFAPPFYPAAQSTALADPAYKGLLQAVQDAVPVTYKSYFNGISDCSYCCLDKNVTEDMLQGNLLLWGDAYPMDFQSLAKIRMPFLLLGPWGKDLHERTERVHIGSLTEDIPKVLRNVIDYVGHCDESYMK